MKSWWKARKTQGSKQSDESSSSHVSLQSTSSPTLPHTASADVRGHVGVPADDNYLHRNASNNKEVIVETSALATLEEGSEGLPPHKSLWPPKGRRRTVYILIAVMTPLLLLAILLSVLLTRSHSHPLSVEHRSGPIVDLGYSQYKGTQLPNGVSQWLGIRYAAPPLGDLRFRAPQDPIRTKDLQDASKVSFSWDGVLSKRLTFLVRSQVSRDGDLDAHQYHLRRLSFPRCLCPHIQSSLGLLLQ